ncbi:MAG: hypothetical protein AAF591_10020 [Verrucomicrobiota bacterium]
MTMVMTEMMQPVVACATCMGDVNSPVMQGFNFAVLLMLGVLVLVLGSFLSFIRYLARCQRQAILVEEQGQDQIGRKEINRRS